MAIVLRLWYFRFLVIYDRLWVNYDRQLFRYIGRKGKQGEYDRKTFNIFFAGNVHSLGPTTCIGPLKTRVKKVSHCMDAYETSGTLTDFFLGRAPTGKI